MVSPVADAGHHTLKGNRDLRTGTPDGGLKAFRPWRSDPCTDSGVVPK